MIYLDVLTNRYDESLLYVNGEAHSDIDDTWAECIIWLEDVLADEVKITRRATDVKREDFPEFIDCLSDTYRWRRIEVSYVMDNLMRHTMKCVLPDQEIVFDPKNPTPEYIRFDALTRGKWFVLME